MTKAQIKTLEHFLPAQRLLTHGAFGNICSTLAKNGLLKFEGYKSGKREFSITDAGMAALGRAWRDP